MAKTSKTRIPREKWMRKNISIDQIKLDRAKQILHASTETDAVDAALDLVSFQEEVSAGIDRLVAAGGLTDPFSRR